MTGRLPLHVLTGFLGSGKTTLLNRMLREPALADSAILINEIGAIAIDHHLVEQMHHGDAMDVVVLQGGCTCCTVRGDLVEALRELYARRAHGELPPFSRAILETTGLADPAPVLFTLVGDAALRHKFEAGTVIATVDAVHGVEQLSRYAECRKQVAVADRLVITKGDIADPRNVASLCAELARLNPAADILDVQGLDALQSLFGGRPFMGRDGHGHALQVPAAEHTRALAALAFTLDDPIEWSPFSVWLSLLLHAHGQNILRFKAMLDVVGWSGPVILDGVQHLVHPPIHLPGWPDGVRSSRIVVIAEAIPMRRIETSLRGFLKKYGRKDQSRVAEPAAAARTFDPSFLSGNLLS
jgi:G3E family GTPase